MIFCDQKAAKLDQDQDFEKESRLSRRLETKTQVSVTTTVCPLCMKRLGLDSCQFFT